MIPPMVPPLSSSSSLESTSSQSTTFARLDWVSLGDKGSAQVLHRRSEDDMRMAVKDRPNPDPRQPHQPWRVLKIGSPKGIFESLYLDYELNSPRMTTYRRLGDQTPSHDLPFCVHVLPPLRMDIDYLRGTKTKSLRLQFYNETDCQAFTKIFHVIGLPVKGVDVNRTNPLLRPQSTNTTLSSHSPLRPSVSQLTDATTEMTSSQAQDGSQLYQAPSANHFAQYHKYGSFDQSHNSSSFGMNDGRSEVNDSQMSFARWANGQDTFDSTQNSAIERPTAMPVTEPARTMPPPEPSIARGAKRPRPDTKGVTAQQKRSAHRRQRPLSPARPPTRSSSRIAERASMNQGETASQRNSLVPESVRAQPPASKPTAAPRQPAPAQKAISPARNGSAAGSKPCTGTSSHRAKKAASAVKGKKKASSAKRQASQSAQTGAATQAKGPVNQAHNATVEQSNSGEAAAQTGDQSNNTADSPADESNRANQTAEQFWDNVIKAATNLPGTQADSPPGTSNPNRPATGATQAPSTIQPVANEPSPPSIQVVITSRPGSSSGPTPQQPTPDTSPAHPTVSTHSSRPSPVHPTVSARSIRPSTPSSSPPSSPLTKTYTRLHALRTTRLLTRFSALPTTDKVSAIEGLHREEALATFAEKYDTAMAGVRDGERREGVVRGLDGLWVGLGPATGGT